MTYTPTEDKIIGDKTQQIYKFANGFGASVVRGPYTYGGDKGLYELGVLGPDGGLAYDTPVTNDVLGWLTEEDVRARLAEIEALPSGYRGVRATQKRVLADLLDSGRLDEDEILAIQRLMGDQ